MRLSFRNLPILLAPALLLVAGCGSGMVNANSSNSAFSITPGLTSIDTNCTGCNATNAQGSLVHQFTAMLAERSPGGCHLVGLRRRRGKWAGKHQRQRPVHAAQLPDRRPRRSSGDRDAGGESQPPRLLRADRHAGIPAAAHAGECGFGRQWKRHHHRLSGRGGRHGRDQLRAGKLANWAIRRPRLAQRGQLPARQQSLHLLHGHLHGAGLGAGNRRNVCGGHGRRSFVQGQTCRGAGEHRRRHQQPGHPPGPVAGDGPAGQLGRQQHGLRHAGQPDCGLLQRHAGRARSRTQTSASTC